MNEAIAALRQALELRPDDPQVHFTLANVYRRNREIEQAIAFYRRAAALRPGYFEALVNVGNLLSEQGRHEEAIAALTEASGFVPATPQASYNLGIALQRGGRFREAIDAYQRAIALRPDYADAWLNLGNALGAEKRFEEACTAYQHVLSLRPQNQLAAWGLAVADLMMGNFARGWAGYELRFRQPSYRPGPSFIQPRWRGEELAGRRILLWAEQGLGTTIQFVRFVKSVCGRGGRVVLQCQPQLRRLLSNQPELGAEQVIGQDERPGSFDLHCPLPSLPWALGTTLQSLPAQVPYLRAENELVVKWEPRLAGGAVGQMRVGIAWASHSLSSTAAERSIPLEQMAPLAEIAGVRLISLQQGYDGKPPFDLHVLEGFGREWADTAAIIQNLDLVISCDTSIAHLAGALGKPVWVLLPYFTDWRWMLDRSDSPWYPTMRLLRQAESGDWQAPIVQAAEHLRERVR